MPVEPAVIGGLLAFLSLPAAALLVLVRSHISRPGARGFVVTIVGWAGWSVVLSVRLVTDSVALAEVLNNFALVFVTVTVLGWVLLVAEYARGRRVPLTPRRLVVWLSVPVALAVVAFTNPAHSLMWGEATRVGAYDTIDIAHGPAFAAAAAYWFLLAEGAALWLARAVVRSEGVFRRQGAALLAGHLLTVPFAYDTFNTFPPAPYIDLSPVGFFLGSVVWGVALFRYGSIELAPIARETTLDEMCDAVVALDNDDVVIDVNRAAADLFADGEDVVGCHARSLFADHDPLAERVLSGEALDERLSLLVDGDTCHVHVVVTPVVSSGATRGRVVVVRDVTELFRREKELAMAKQVLSRVFRHDIRNDLTVIRGYAELIAERTGGEVAAMAGTISDKTDELATTANKARRIERALDSSTAEIDLEVTSLLHSSVESVRAGHPQATYEVDLPPELWVRASTDLEAAFRNVIENAVVHNDGPDPTVEVSARRRDGSVVVTVSDDGPGIPRQEVEVLDRREEAPLSHTSGVGLWLVTAIVERSDGDVAFDTGGDGTTVEVRLPAATDPDRDAYGPRRAASPIREQPSDRADPDRAEPA